MIRTLMLMALLLAVGASWAADVQVLATPPLPLPNPVKNAGFEIVDARGLPDEWKFTTANPENFEQNWVAQGHFGPGSVRVMALTGIMSGYWTQSLLVKPDTEYVLRVWYRHGGGKMLIRAHGGNPEGRTVDERFYDTSMRKHFLVPVFLKPEYMKGGDLNQWRLCRLPFKTIPNMEWISISLGIFFSGGEVWFDDVSVTEAKTDLTVRVTGAVEKLRVLDEQGKAVFESGKSDQGLQKTLPGVASDGVYTIEVTEPGGNVRTMRYPEVAK